MIILKWGKMGNRIREIYEHITRNESQDTKNKIHIHSINRIKQAALKKIYINQAQTLSYT